MKKIILIVSGLVIIFIVSTTVWGFVSIVNDKPAPKTDAEIKAEQRIADKEVALQKAQALQQASDLAKWDASPAGILCAKHPDWDKEVCTTIIQKKVFVGMTFEQARMAWGAPEKINTTTTATVVRQQWVYVSGNYLYFKNGILVSISS